jgi:hypothetical protein
MLHLREIMMVVDEVEETKEKWVTIGEAQKILGMTQGKFYRRLKYLGIRTERRNMRNWQERYVDVNELRSKLGL